MDFDEFSPEHLYKKIADQLRNDIVTGRYKLHDRIPTEIELAASFAVSRGTVRKALDQLVREGLFTRIKGKGTFVCGTVVGSRSTQIGVVVPWLHDHLISEMLRGIESRLRDKDFTLLLGHSDGDPEMEARQVSRFLEDKVGGIILFPAQNGEEYAPVNTVIPEQFPLVVLDRRLSGRDADLVQCDNFNGARIGVNALIEAGHRDIACLTPSSRPSSIIERIRGYETAMRENGLFPLAAIETDAVTLIGRADGSDTSPFGFEHSDFHELQRLLDSPLAPTAIFCINDYLAFSVLEYFRSHGINVPNDISLVGFDDHPFSTHASVRLSSVSQDAHLAGQKAASLILERIENPAKDPVFEKLATRLVCRESIAPPPG